MFIYQKQFYCLCVTLKQYFTKYSTYTYSVFNIKTDKNNIKLKDNNQKLILLSLEDIISEPTIINSNKKFN